jgi:hypothetical protein
MDCGVFWDKTREEGGFFAKEFQRKNQQGVVQGVRPLYWHLP